MKEFLLSDYLNSEADIRALLDSAIEHHDGQVLIRCIKEIAKLKQMDLDPIDSFYSVSQAMNAIGYKFVIKNSKK